MAEHDPTDPASGRTSPRLRTCIYTRGLSKESRDLQHELIVEAVKTHAFRHLELVPPLYVETTRTNSVVEGLLHDGVDGKLDAMICYDIWLLGNVPEEAIDICNRLLCTGVRIFSVTGGELTSHTLLIAKPRDSNDGESPEAN